MDITHITHKHRIIGDVGWVFWLFEDNTEDYEKSNPESDQLNDLGANFHQSHVRVHRVQSAPCGHQHGSTTKKSKNLLPFASISE